MNCSLSQATPTQRSPKIVVLGGGIAGLSVYASLRKLNLNVQVYERSSKNRLSGMGFLILQNGVDTLMEMGLSDAFSNHAKQLENYITYGSEGALGLSTPLEGVYAVKRNDILTLLEQQVCLDHIHYGKAFDHFLYNESGSAAAAVMKDGTVVYGDVFIAADGIHSKVRKELFPEAELEETENHELVCVLPNLDERLSLNNDLVKFLDSEAGVNMGLFRLRSNEVLWYLQFDKTKHGTPLANNREMTQFIAEIGAYLPDTFRDILFNSKVEDCFYWKTSRMDLLPAFHRENVLLIGDAAHPLLTFTSQGVNSALRDSIVLANLFEEGYDTSSELFSAFYIERKDEILRYIQEGDELLEQFSSAKFQGLPLVC